MQLGIPAFLSTYTGKNASRGSLNLFPNMLKMLPNWSLTYGGLSKLPFFESHFKSFNLRHAYKSVYAIGNYNTYNSYMEFMNGRGFIQDVTTGAPIPSSMYNIGAVSINESFTPDYEDANSDFTLDEYEKYFQYRVSLRPQDLQLGKNYIADKREVKVKLRNGNSETVNWYCFRIPVKEYEKAVGSIRDFSSIRFMRMYLTGFTEEVHVRFATLELMRSQWRNYEQPIASAVNRTPTLSGTFSAASVNIEENGDRSPVNYVVQL